MQHNPLKNILSIKGAILALLSATRPVESSMANASRFPASATEMSAWSTCPRFGRNPNTGIFDPSTKHVFRRKGKLPSTTCSAGLQTRAWSCRPPLKAAVPATTCMVSKGFA
jgi:hypothetical protein